MCHHGDVRAATPSDAVRQSPSRLTKLLFVALIGGALALEAGALFFHRTGVPAIARGERPRLIGEIAGQTVVTQTFRIDVDGFSGLVLEASPYHETASGNVVFTVEEFPGGSLPTAGSVGSTDTAPRAVRRVTHAATDVVAVEAFELSFEPIEQSGGRQYRLEVQAPDAPAGQGIGLWATRDQAYRGGLLAVGGVEQWGDLVLTGHATQATLWRRLEHALRAAPAWLRSSWTLAVALVLYNWALVVIAWHVLLISLEPGRVRDPQPDAI
jgi:hypothetical protein